MNINKDIYLDDRLNSLLDELEDMKIELTDEEEKDLAEIASLKDSIKGHDILKDFGDAALKGMEDYLNSFIDTSEIVNDMKNPGAIRRRNDSTVKFKHPSSDPDKPNPVRTLQEAKSSPYADNAERDNSLKSDKGRKRLAYYEEAYKQRTKTISDHSNDLSGNISANQIALAGIESFQFGPKVDLYTPDEYKQMYEDAGSPDNTASFIRSRNFDKFYSEKYSEFGFENKTQFMNWCRSNKFTIHETPDGMYLVPTDVHASEYHSGEVSILHKYLRGEITKDDLVRFENETRVAKITYETATRATRAGKAIGIGSAKILIQQVSSIIVTETYFVFTDDNGKEADFTEKIKLLVRNCSQKMKEQVKPTLQKLAKGAAGNVGMEILNALNDFVFKTAKNIMKVIRAMIGSIIRALKVLVGKQYSWNEKVFEALKILSAGLVAALGFSLNELITDLLTGTGIPPLVVAAPFIGDVLSGLLASVLSSLVLMLFDSYKDSLETKNAENRIAILEMQLSGYKIALAGIEQAKTDILVAQTGQYVVSRIEAMEKEAEDIDGINDTIKIKNEQIRDEIRETAGALVESRKLIASTRIKINALNKLLENNE